MIVTRGGGGGGMTLTRGCGPGGMTFASGGACGGMTLAWIAVDDVIVLDATVEDGEWTAAAGGAAAPGTVTFPTKRRSLPALTTSPALL